MSESTITNNFDLLLSASSLRSATQAEPTTPSNQSRFDSRIIPSIDYTLRDSIYDNLYDAAKCIFMMAIPRSEDDPQHPCIFFNNGLYSKEMMDTHKHNEATRNQNRLQSGYTTSINDFRDPRTREVFSYNMAISWIKSEYSLPEVINFIINRAGVQLTEMEAVKFIPCQIFDNIVTADNFVDGIQVKFNSRINNHNDYNNYIRSQQENAHENPMDYLNRRYTEESSRVLAQSHPPSNEVSNESFEALPNFIGNATGQGLLLSLLDEAQSRGIGLN